VLFDLGFEFLVLFGGVVDAGLEVFDLGGALVVEGTEFLDAVLHGSLLLLDRLVSAFGRVR